ncbi:hypothetical protein Dimus_004042 [Dionaea muscipula]
MANAIGNIEIIGVAEEDHQIEQTTPMNPTKKAKSTTVNRGAWTAEEDRKLAEAIEFYGAKRWKKVASKAGLNRCGKSCRLRWMNYLRPNIKRGNISNQEEDLILRLHKLLGNRWSLIAGRIPGRTDNEIKNYWNSHLSKKMKHEDKQTIISVTRGEEKKEEEQGIERMEEEKIKREKEKELDQDYNSLSCFNVDDFFDFSNEDPSNLEWLPHFVDVGQGLCQF